jgi:hypothetical protein
MSALVNALYRYDEPNIAVMVDEWRDEVYALKGRLSAQGASIRTLDLLKSRVIAGLEAKLEDADDVIEALGRMSDGLIDIEVGIDDLDEDITVPGNRHW